MKFRVFQAILAALLLSSGLDAADTERFVGVLQHDELQTEQLAKLDLILNRTSDNRMEYSAVLTLHFGDFASQEYVSYHFHKVERFLLEQSFTFDQADQPATISQAKLRGDVLSGEFRSERMGLVGKLILKRGGSIAPKGSILEPIWGEYSGRCDPYGEGALRTNVQLYTYRSTDDISRVGNPFSAYQIQGYLGQDKGDTCINDLSTRMCIWSRFYRGSYNFFKGRLQLTGKNRHLNCRVKDGELLCGDCKLKRISNETARPRQLTPPTSTAFFANELDNGGKALGDSSSIRGEYQGYLHHEYLDSYQPTSLNLVTYPVVENGKQKLILSATATLNFGKFDSFESLSYRFKSRTFPNPLTLSQFVLRRPEADVDAVLAIQKIRKGIVTGTWYSQLFGRVGTFVLKKDAPPPLPTGARLLPALSGTYASPQWDLNLLVAEGETPPNTENPFFPLIFTGHTRFSPIGGRARTILGGSYDFYTGRIAFSVEGIASRVDSTFVGTLDSSNRLFLKRTGKNLILPLSSHQLTLFRSLTRRKP